MQSVNAPPILTCERTSQPLNTAPSKDAAKASIYIFIPSSGFFRRRPWGGRVLAVSRQLFGDICLLRLYRRRLSSRSEAAKILNSMNNVPTGDGIKKHWDFHINSISVELQRAYYALMIREHIPPQPPTCNGMRLNKLKCLFLLFRGIFDWTCDTNWSGMHSLHSSGAKDFVTDAITVWMRLQDCVKNHVIEHNFFYLQVY